MCRRLVTPLVVALALAGAPAASAQAPTLTGERLDGGATPSLGIGAVALDCRPTGTSTGSYTIAGAAIGPFPGTFEETASFTIVDRMLTTFESTFTIQSGLTEVRGTKTLRTSGLSVCLDAPGSGLADFADIALIASYEATITTPLGVFMDEGRVSSGAQMQTTPDGRASAASQQSFISEAVLSAPTAGHVTGGGYLGDVVNDWISFGFTAKSNGTTVKAQCSVSDHSTGVHVKCLDATLLAQTSTHATFEGRATVDGNPTRYRIDVDDLGDPGAGRDRFQIVTDEGFAASGVLAGGNIQIHD